MADSLLSQTGIAISTLPETAYNTMFVLASGYDSLVTRARSFPLPSNEKGDDTGTIGRGSKSIYPSVQTTGFLEPQVIEIQDKLNVGSFVKQLRRFMGKPELVGDIQVVEAAIAFRHHYYEQDPDALGRQLPASDIVYRNNGADFVYGGMVGSSLQLQQAGVADPTYTIQHVGSGLYQRIRDITSPAFGTLADPATENYMLGPETRVQYTDPTTTRSMTSGRRLKSISFTANNNLDTNDLRAGAPRVNGTGCPGSGWYRDFLNMGDKTATAQFRVTVDDNMFEWTNAQTDAIITNFTWTNKGYCVPTTAATNQYEVTLKIGKCYFRTPRGGDDNNTLVKDLTVFPVLNASYWGVYKFEVVNGVNAIVQ
jgi:hypothetical protein